MTIIREMQKSLFNLLGKQTADAEKVYRRISFCILTAIDGVTVAYNALTGEIVELTAAEVETLQAETVGVTAITAPLIERWFFVPVEHDDIQLSDEVLNFLRLFEKQDGIKGYTIFTTMDCNARCFYCYEMGRPRTPMSLQTAKDVVTFIEKNAPKDKKITLNWFGGEPLYNAEVIDVITEGLDALGITYKSKITSNGYLFDAATAKKAAEKWNVQSVQITLDGTEKVYNKAKAYIHSENVNPFYLVTDNIELLLKNGIRVFIRLNMGAYNGEDLYRLIDWLAERYKGYDNLKVYAHLLFETDANKLLLPARAQLSEELCKLERYCLEKGLLSVGSIPTEYKANCCMADSAETVTILPNGNLGKCEHFSEDKFVGTIYDGITDLAMVEKFKQRDNSKEMCAGCAAYPRCIRLTMCEDIVTGICDSGTRMHTNEKMRRELVHTYRKIKEQKKKAE